MRKAGLIFFTAWGIYLSFSALFWLVVWSEYFFTSIMPIYFVLNGVIGLVFTLFANHRSIKASPAVLLLTNIVAFLSLIALWAALLMWSLSHMTFF
jgi:hypothetical protein